jgi:hypothetical protein
MLAFLGPAQAVGISPFCTLEDVTAWAATDSTTLSLLVADAVWRQMLASHFHSAFARLSILQERSTTAEKLAVQLPPPQQLREVYATLQRRSSECPFVLTSRARLLLEIHELREWDRYRKQFVEQQQALRLAELLADSKAAEQLRRDAAPTALELVSLQNMMSDNQPGQLPQLEDVQWGRLAEEDLRSLVEQRLQQRKKWWQRQREYLLQGLDPP